MTMLNPIHLSNASMSQVAESLSQRENEDFILIYRDMTTDEWVIDLNSKLDGLLVANLLGTFQCRVLELMLQQQESQKALSVTT